MMLSFHFSGSPVIHSYSELSQDDPSVVGKSHIVLLCNMSSTMSLSTNDHEQPLHDLELDFWWTVPGGEIVAGNKLVLEGLEDSGPYTCNVKVTYSDEQYVLQSSTYIDSGLCLSIHWLKNIVNLKKHGFCVLSF